MQIILYLLSMMQRYSGMGLNRHLPPLSTESRPSNQNARQGSGCQTTTTITKNDIFVLRVSEATRWILAWENPYGIIVHAEQRWKKVNKMDETVGIVSFLFEAALLICLIMLVHAKADIRMVIEAGIFYLATVIRQTGRRRTGMSISDQDRENMIQRIISICDEARRRYKASVYHNCNNCGRKECQFARWNCPLWEEGEEPEADGQGV